MELQTDRAEQHSILNSSNAPTILCRWWVPACLTAWIIFVVYEIGIGFDQLYSRHPICPYSDREYSPLYWLVNYVVLGAFLLTWIMLLMKIFQMKPGPTRVPLLTAFHIVSIGTIATILALVWNWGGVCIDALGVASPAAIWGEWIATAPLLVLITVTIVDKPELSKTDWFLMITFSFCLVFAWLIIVNESYGWGVFWFLVSASMYLPMLYLPFYLTRNSFISPEGLNNEYTSAPIDEDNAALEDITDAYLYMKRYYLAMLLTIILPMYTFSYILAWAGVIDGASIIAIYQVLSGTTKGLFAALCMDAHIDALMEAERAVERRANVARRAFLKYIFHEVRTPLNSLTMGIEILQMSENLEEEDMESLIMMKGASEFMSDTLNDVLSMQKIEEGKLELDLSPFSIKDAISKVILSLRGASTMNSITFHTYIGDYVPVKVLGDRYRIEHVISNLLSNAIKFSSYGKCIRIVVSCGAMKTVTNNRIIADITISILDEGTIGVHSVEGQGSTFSFTVPFVIYVDLTPIMADGNSARSRGSAAATTTTTTTTTAAAAITTSTTGTGTAIVAVPTARKDRDSDGDGDGEVLSPPMDCNRESTRETSSIVTVIPATQIKSCSNSNNNNNTYNDVENNHHSSKTSTDMTMIGSGSGSGPGPGSVPSFYPDLVPISGCKSGSGTRSASASASIVPCSRMTGNDNRIGGGGGGGTGGDSARRRVTIAAHNTKVDYNTSSGSSSNRGNGSVGLEVLVVDDAESNRKMMMMLLRKNGVSPSMAENGQKALDVIRNDVGEKYTLVFMDNLMPVMNGVEATKALRREGYRHIIVGVTGNVLEDDIREYLAAGADFIIGKPLKKPSLDMILRHVAERGTLSLWNENMRLVEHSNRLEWTTWR
eukprot:gene687-1316_t